MYSTAVSLSLPSSPPFYHYQHGHPHRPLPHLYSLPSLFSSSSSSPPGLQTPPGDCDPSSAMGTTYQPPLSAAYEDHRHGPSYTTPAFSLLSEADRRRSILSELTNSAVLGSNAVSRNFGSSSAASSVCNSHHDSFRSEPPPSQQPQQPPSIQHLRQVYGHSQPPDADLMSTHSFSTEPSTPTSSHAAAPPPQTTSSAAPIVITDQDSASMVMHSLDVPRCISPRGGSLSTFTAELTCLFWFESPVVYQLADSISSIPDNVAISRVCANAVPSASFKSWVSRMLTTTQVTQNVVFLALLFIYRLKSLNPRVRGKPGSEFRLLTVALMLGNKFLDDNTYTNKTWSDVSALNVKDIHIMEVEFLSNMRYSLLVSATEWKDWLVKLAKFRIYYERATSVNATAPAPAAVTISPQRQPFASPLPSPTTIQPAPSLPISYDAANYSPGRPVYAGVGTAMTQAQAQAQAQPWPANPEMNPFGKRAHGYDDLTEPPPKRAVRNGQQPSATLPPVTATLGSVVPAPLVDPFNTVRPVGAPAPVSETLRLPVPHLTLNTSAAAGTGFGTTGPVQVPQVSQVALSLPPLTHGVRAMSTVYPTTGVVAANAGGVPSYAPKLPVPPSAGGPSMGSMSVSTDGTTPTGYAPATAFGTPTKRMSPMSALTPSVASVYASGGGVASSSPLTESFGHVSTGHSPSLYLQQRTSPYRPIRHVNTLLNPPPTSLQEYQASGPLLIPPTQMYYQPLGRRNDLRTGIVPEFQGLQFAGGVRPYGLAPVLGIPGMGMSQGMSQGMPGMPQGVLARPVQVQQQAAMAAQQQQQHQAAVAAQQHQAMAVQHQPFVPGPPHYGHYRQG